MTVHEIFRYIKQSTKKSLMSKISTISLGLKFKLDRNELDKACLDLDVAYSDSKDLVKRTIWDKILKDRAYQVAKNRSYDGCQRAFASMVYKLFHKKTASEISVHEQVG